jgi:probable addiction module antidote protein
VMEKRTRSYSDWRQQKLADPVRAVRYLKAAKKQSNEAFLHAVKNVIQANEVARIARKVGVSRESIYRSFAADGNPAFHTVDDILKVVGIELDFKVVGVGEPTSTPSNVNRIAQANPDANVVVSQATGKILTSSSAMAEIESLGIQNLGVVYSATNVTSNESIDVAQLGLLPGFIGHQQQQIGKLSTLHE